MLAETYILDQWAGGFLLRTQIAEREERDAAPAGAKQSSASPSMLTALRTHWPEYLMEAAGLGIFMVAACLSAALLEYPGSPARAALPDGTLRRILGGLAMGLTAICIIYSPWGQQSGAHLNPAFTLAFFRLGKVARWDAVFYVLAQFAGGVAGVLLSTAMLGPILGDPAVSFAATVPGPAGSGAAFAAEVAISFLLMLTVLSVSNTSRLTRFTGLFAGVLIWTFISVEAPFSGMSMNPARTLGSALPGGIWTSLWVYFTAPPLGMLLAAEWYARRKGLHRVLCAKLNHQTSKRCIFRCGYMNATPSTCSDRER